MGYTCCTDYDKCNTNQSCSNVNNDNEDCICVTKESFELIPNIKVQNKNHIIKNLSKPQLLLWDYIKKSKNENLKSMFNKSDCVLVPGDFLATTIHEMTDEKEKISKILEFFKSRDQCSNEYDTETICTVTKKREGGDLTIHFLKDSNETTKSNPTCPIPPEPNPNENEKNKK